MSITINARGTSVPFFTIGKNGTTLYQGSSDPSLTHTPKTGDIWFNTTTHALETWVTSAWSAPRLADLNFVDSSVVAATSTDLSLTTTLGNKVVIDAGAGPGTITSVVGNDLYITESLGGNLYLNANKWPSADGTANQTLITNGSGALSWASSVSSLSGTSNQVSVSSSTGGVTISTPSTFVAPGSLQYTTQFGYTVESIAAAGSTQGTAAQITKTQTDVSSATSLQGVILPTPLFNGEYHLIHNGTSVQIYVYPNSGFTIDNASVNSPVYINAGQTIGIIYHGTSEWHTTSQPIAAGNSGILVTNNLANISISNTGVLSFSAGTTGFTPLTSSTGNITLGGVLSIGAGGTNADTALTAFNNLSPLTTIGDTLYHNGTDNVRLPVGSSTQVLSVAAGIPTWVSRSAMTVGASTTSTNLSGGIAGSIPYQTTTGATSFVAVGTSSQVLISGTTPSFVSIPTVLGYTPVNKSGDTMLGTLTLNADPVLPLQAATKQYVDAVSVGLSAQPAVKIAQLVDLTTIGNGSSGPITSIGSFTPGSLYTDGTFTNVTVLSNNIGAGALATVVISGNVVTSFTITTPGNRYSVGDELYISTIAGASGAGFVSTVTSVSASWGTVTYTAGTTDLNGGTGIGATLTPAANGLFVLDAYKFSINDRVLIKAQTNQTQNGIYTVTSLGSPSTTWVLTRATDYDDSVINQIIPGNYIFVTDGKNNKNTGWTQVALGTSSVVGAKTDAIKIGTDNISYVQFSGNTVYTSGTGLELIGSEFFNTGVLNITTNTGLSTNVNTTGEVTITNTGVTSITAGSGISVSSSTGAVTISAANTVQNVTSNYTVLSTDYSIFANAVSGGFTVTLPSSPTANEIHNIKKVDQTRAVVTISGNGHNIDKYTSIVINVPFVSMAMQWNATTSTWQLI